MMFIFFVCSWAVSAQKSGDTSVIKTSGHSAKKAVILSAVLPGAGQFYNKKYWKIPIIYAAGSTLIYFAATNHTRYIPFRDANRILSNSNDPNLEVTLYNHAEGHDVTYANTSEDLARLVKYRDSYKRQRDLNIIGTFLLYALNLIDANVDGQLYDFDVSDDLSLHWQPVSWQTAMGPVNGLNLTLKF